MGIKANVLTESRQPVPISVFWCLPCSKTMTRCLPLCAPRARGYLLKSSSKAEICSAIQSVQRGEAVFGAPIAKRVTKHFANLSTASIAANSFPELSERELCVKFLMAQHKSNQEIANELGIASKTIRNHVSNILNKLQVVDRAQAMIRVKQAGLGSDPISSFDR